MKRIVAYCMLVAVLLLFVEGCRQDNRRMPSLDETYRYTDAQPFGTFIAFKGFQSEFESYDINIAERPFYQTWTDMPGKDSGKYSLYFLVTKNLILNLQDGNAMLDYVKAGNDLFISADYIDHKLLDALDVTVNRSQEISDEAKGKMRNTSIRLFYGKEISTDSYSYYYYPFGNYFSSYDTSSARVLGVNEKGLANFMVFFAGNGRLYLQLAPRSFSNYFLLTDNNYRYFEYATTYLRFEPRYVYWDEYYNSHASTKNKNSLDDKETFSSLSVLRQNASLSRAFYIAITGILLYGLFHMKRKQRQLVLIPPLKNATAEFAETVGMLYLQHDDNRNVALKIVAYFYDYLRTRYHIPSEKLNNEHTKFIAHKSGHAETEIVELFDCIKSIRDAQSVSNANLLLLDQKVEHFKNNTWKKI